MPSANKTTILPGLSSPRREMDIPHSKRGKLHNYELVSQFAPHTRGDGQPKQLRKVVALPKRTFFSCSTDEVKLWRVGFGRSAEGVLQHEVLGTIAGLKRFTRGYTACSVPPSAVHCLPDGGVVFAGVGSLNEPSATIYFCDLKCQSVAEVEIEGVGHIVSLTVNSDGHVVVGGSNGIAAAHDFRETSSGKGNRTATMSGHEGEVHVFGGLPDGLIACGSAGSKLVSEGVTDAALRLWRGQQLLRRIKDQDENVRCFASGNGTEVVFLTGSSDSSWVARSRTGEPFLRNYVPLNWIHERANILSIACVGTGAGSEFVTGDDDKPGRMIIWDHRASELQTVFHPHEVCDLVASECCGNEKSSGSGSSDILSACRDGFVRVWSRHLFSDPADQASLRGIRELLTIAVQEAQKNRLQLQQLQAGGGPQNAVGGGDIDGIRFDHTVQILLDDAPGTPTIPIRFNQGDFYKDVARDAAIRHGLNDGDKLSLETAIRAEQEKAAGPPRGLGPPGERVQETKVVQRQFSEICINTIQRSVGGEVELLRKLESLNNGLIARNRTCALQDSELQQVKDMIETTAAGNKTPSSWAHSSFANIVAKMLREWPAKTLFVPFGLIRIAALNPLGASWFCDRSSTLSVSAILQRSAEVLTLAPSSLVCVSAVLALINVLSNQSSNIDQLVSVLADDVSVTALDSVLSSVKTVANLDDKVMDHCASLCVNISLLLCKHAPPQHTPARRPNAAKLEAGRTIGDVVLKYFVRHFQDDTVDSDDAAWKHVMCQVVCNIASNGFVKRDSESIWGPLATAMSASSSWFHHSTNSLEEVDCLLRYRGPVFEAVTSTA